MSDLPKEIQAAGAFLDSFETDVLLQLFLSGPLFDGDVSSKRGRDGLVTRGLAIRQNGWQTLSEAGFIAAVEAGYGERKETWDAKRRSKSADLAPCILLLNDKQGVCFNPGKRFHGWFLNRAEDGKWHTYGELLREDLPS
jgi:hypothetical protein